MFVAAADAVRRHLVARGEEGDRLDDLHEVLTRTVINALGVAADEAQRIMADLSADQAVTH